MFTRRSTVSFCDRSIRQLVRCFISTQRNVTIVDRKESALQVLDKVINLIFVVYLIVI